MQRYAMKKRFVAACGDSGAASLEALSVVQRCTLSVPPTFKQKALQSTICSVALSV